MKHAVLEQNGGIERGEDDGEIRDDGAQAGAAGEEREVLVFAFGAVAGGAAAFEAGDVGLAIIPAAGMLQEIAGEGGDVANLGGADLGGGFGEAGEGSLD